MKLRDLDNLPRKFFLLTAMISFAGFLDASYLTAKKVQGGPINCFVLSGCDVVSNSGYSVLFGLPLALYGAAFYLAIFILSLAFLERRNPVVAVSVGSLSLVGLFVTTYLLYLQKFVIGAFCFYCVLSAVFSAAIFATMVAAFIFLRRKRVSGDK